MLKRSCLLLTPALSYLTTKYNRKKAQRSISHAFTCHFSSSFLYLSLSLSLSLSFLLLLLSFLSLLLLLLLLEVAMSLVGYKRIHKGTTPFPIPLSSERGCFPYLNIFFSIFQRLFPSLFKYSGMMTQWNDRFVGDQHRRNLWKGPTFTRTEHYSIPNYPIPKLRRVNWG